MSTRFLPLAALGAALFAGQAQAAIVYSGPLSQTLTASVTGEQELPIDMLGTTARELTIEARYNGTQGGVSVVAVGPKSGGTSFLGSTYPTRLDLDDMIDATDNYSNGGTIASHSISGGAGGPSVFRGEWQPVSVQGFLGVRLGSTGSYRYGWLDLTMNNLDRNPAWFASVTLNGWAYEDTGAAIAAGDTTGLPRGDVPLPGTLALLALGALGLVRRARRTA